MANQMSGLELLLYCTYRSTVPPSAVDCVNKLRNVLISLLTYHTMIINSHEIITASPLNTNLSVDIFAQKSKCFVYL